MEMIRTLLTSKKVAALITGYIVARLGPDTGINEELIKWMLGLIGSYIVGQGIADNGKVAAEITAKATIAAQAPAPKAPATKRVKRAPASK